MLLIVPSDDLNHRWFDDDSGCTLVQFSVHTLQRANVISPAPPEPKRPHMTSNYVYLSPFGGSTVRREHVQEESRLK